MRIFMFACMSVLAIGGVATGQSARKESGNNAQLVQQMQQLAAERTSLQTENTRLKRELDELRKERDGLKGERETSDRKLRSAEGAATRASGDRKQLEDDLAQQKDRMTELVGKFRETVATMRDIETERATAQQQLEVRSADLKSCVDRNAQLYTMNDEILQRLDGQGVFSGLARAEPFTRIKRTQLENLADDYRARAEEARMQPAAPVHQTTPAAAPGS